MNKKKNYLMLLISRIAPELVTRFPLSLNQIMFTKCKSDTRMNKVCVSELRLQFDVQVKEFPSMSVERKSFTCMLINVKWELSWLFLCLGAKDYWKLFSVNLIYFENSGNHDNEGKFVNSFTCGRTKTNYFYCDCNYPNLSVSILNMKT